MIHLLYNEILILMPKNTEKPIDGTVIECLPNTTFRVQLTDGREILAHLSGKMRMNFIKILQGDRVSVEVGPDGKRGRVVYRYK